MEECAECVRLWRTYANATTDHVNLEDQLKVAAKKQPWPSALRSLTLSVEASARVREIAREAIRTHEAVAHGKTATV